MQALMITLTILMTSIMYSVYSQLLFLELKQDNTVAITSENQSQKLIRKANYRDPGQETPIFNDCSLLTRSNYFLPESYVSNFVQMKNGQSYRGSKSGIVMWDNFMLIRISTENSKIPENNITALAFDQQNQLWIGTHSSGIVIGTGADIKPFRIEHIQTHDQNIVSIAADDRGLIWVVFQNGGLECFKNGISCAYFPKE